MEFGCKVLTSAVNGYSFVERMSFNSFNEGGFLIEAVENYKERFGFYPEAVMGDTIFRNRGNAKRKYGLARIKTKLSETTESSIVLQFLVLNLER
ncbi:MAG TPA: hypothetical protein VM577_02970, partial [Anaerovoracaceae bacterium]|nr:hypothetical protein [Anaerovoracaceae bacterium]